MNNKVSGIFIIITDTTLARFQTKIYRQKSWKNPVMEISKK